MKKNQLIGTLGGLLLIGAVAWYFFPMMLFGFTIASDHLNSHDSAKADIEQYVHENYGDTFSIRKYAYDGEADNHYLVALMKERKHEDTYKLYYDLKSKNIVFDELEMEQPTGKEMVTGTVAYKNLGKEIRQYENLSYIYEKELEQARLEQKAVKADHIEVIFEKISMDLGALNEKKDKKLSYARK